LKLNKTEHLDVTRYEKNTTVMIYLIFVQYIKHRMQITQKCWEYDLTIKSVKF